MVLKQLRAEGIDIVENGTVERVEHFGGGVRVHVASEGARGAVDGTPSCCWRPDAGPTSPS